MSSIPALTSAVQEGQLMGNRTSFTAGPEGTAWKAPLKHGGRSRILFAGNRRTAEKAVARELRDGKRAYWQRQAARLEFAVSCYVKFFEREGGVLTPRGTLRRPVDMWLRTEAMLMGVYRLIEGRQVAEEPGDDLTALLRGGA